MSSIIIGVGSLLTGGTLGFLISSLCTSCTVRDKEEEIEVLKKKLYSREEINK